VHGAGDGATWKYYYAEVSEAKKQRKKFSQLNIDEKVKLAVEKNAAEAEKKQLRPHKRPKMSWSSRQSMQL
jgi:hypothetical protein